MKQLKVLALVTCCAVIAGAFTGCFIADSIEFATPAGPPRYPEMSKAYHLTELRSSAADVLPLMYDPQYTLLSQSTRVLAASGEKRKGYMSWFTMVSFDENDLLAKRKYLFVVDEKPKKIMLWGTRAGLRFDSQMALEGDVLTEPYADENARRAALLKFAQDNIHSDIGEVQVDNKSFEVSGALINQGLGAVLQDLEDSPSLAARLSDEEGLAFSHVGFDKGVVGMTDDGKIMTIKMRLGSFTKDFQKVEDVNYPPEPNLDT